VKIIVKQYNTILGITTSGYESTGSGVIFGENSSNYFVLTNNHVTYNDPDYDKITYTIEDYKGNTYTAKYKHGLASYDLSVLYFAKGQEKLGIIKRSKVNPSVGEEIVTLTQPGGQNNAISFGEILSYISGPKLQCSTSESNVKFDVIKHNSDTKGGSSGGMLLDFDLNLIGIHYAGSYDSNGNVVNGYAIPIEKVNEYLSKYIFS
jgi:serine protease Do